MKESTKKKGILDVLAEEEAPIGQTVGLKGHWKVVDGDWVWIPVDESGVPLAGNS